MFPADTDDTQAPPPTQNDVTSFQDTGLESTTVSDVSAIDLYQGLSVYPLESTSQIICRPYPVATFQWSTDDNPGTVLGALNFPDLLFAKAFIANKLANFTYMRAGVRVTARCNGNKFLYGGLMLSWTPAAHLLPTSDPQVNLFTASGNPHTLLCINDAVMPEMDMPYISPDPYVNIGNYQSGCIGTLDVIVAASLQSVSPLATNKVEVTLYAEFTDATVEGPTPTVHMGSPTPVTHLAYA